MEPAQDDARKTSHPCRRRQLTPYIRPRSALIMTAVDRWGMVEGALGGYRAPWRCHVFSWAAFLSARKRQSTPSPLRLPRCCHVCRLNGCIRWGNPRRNATLVRSLFSTGKRYNGRLSLHLEIHARSHGCKIIITNTTTPTMWPFSRTAALASCHHHPGIRRAVFWHKHDGSRDYCRLRAQRPGRLAHAEEYFCWMDQVVQELKFLPDPGVELMIAIITAGGEAHRANHVRHCRRRAKSADRRRR